MHARAVPVMQAARDLIDADLDSVPGGSKNNLTFVSSFVNFDPTITEAERLTLADAQTSGGLLISCPAEKADRAGTGLTGRRNDNRGAHRGDGSGGRYRQD